MNTPLSWIKDYVPDLVVTDQEYADAMTLSGTKVENYQRLDANLDKIVIGKIEKIEKHPDADKLIICQVNIGTEMIQIVTGAPNVAEGHKVPVVLDGGRVAGSHNGKTTPPESLKKGGIKIKKGKLRGVESFGMLCSIEELGSTREFYPEAPEDGIYIFDEDVEIGADAIEILGLRDTVFEYEITSNRVDCYSVIGIAREAAATFRKPFVLPVAKCEGNDEQVGNLVSIEVKDADLCPRYCARAVRNVKIAPSPKWMQRRLAACGIRPINNLVDITNYVMEEYGQPMHAFDLSTLAGNQIIVRRAKADEEFQTLDGQMRIMDENILMICDAEKPIGIAGIMGGENSKITDNVKDVLLESACFNGTNVRLSSKRLGLRTDASGKFEKGLDPNNAEAAIHRACQLIEALGVGEVVGGMVDVYPGEAAQHELQDSRRIPLDTGKINRLLGTDLDEETMILYFEMLGFSYEAIEHVSFKEVIIPSFRQDIECLADLAEEVARFYGYDNIPATLPQGEATAGKLSFKLRIEAIARDAAECYGFSQGMSYSFESPKVYDKLLIPADSDIRNAVVIANPLGEDYSIMRTISLNGLLTSLATNYNRRNKNIRLYELGNIYIPKQVPVTALPDERMQFTLGMYGEGDFYTMKGVIEEFLEKAGLHNKVHYNPMHTSTKQNEHKKPFLHPGMQAEMTYEGSVIGYLGAVHPQVCDHYHIGERTYIAVIDMPIIVEKATFDRKFEGVAKYPAVTRDISMVVPKQIMAGQIEEVFEQYGGSLLESYHLFDIYEGEQITGGNKSIAYSIVFRAKDRTLEDKDVTEVMQHIVEELNRIGVELRA